MPCKAKIKTHSKSGLYVVSVSVGFCVFRFLTPQVLGRERKKRRRPSFTLVPISARSNRNKDVKPQQKRLLRRLLEEGIIL